MRRNEYRVELLIINRSLEMNVFCMVFLFIAGFTIYNLYYSL